MTFKAIVIDITTIIITDSDSADAVVAKRN